MGSLIFFLRLLQKCNYSQVFNSTEAVLWNQWNFQVACILSKTSVNKEQKNNPPSVLCVMSKPSQGCMFLSLCSASNEKELKTRHDLLDIQTWSGLFNELVMRKKPFFKWCFYIRITILRQHYMAILEILLNFFIWAGKIYKPQQESLPKVYFFIPNEESFPPGPNSHLHRQSWYLNWKTGTRSHSYS